MTMPDDGIGAAVSTAHDGAHTRRQLVEVEWLDHLVVRACIEAGDSMLHFISSGDDDDGSGISAFAQIAQNIDAVTMRQAEVEKHHIEHRRL